MAPIIKLKRRGAANWKRGKMYSHQNINNPLVMIKTILMGREMYL